MYEDFFGLRERPFALVPDPDYLYLSRHHRAGLNMLEYGLSSEATFMMITGEVGAGKTILIRRFLKMVGPDVSVGLITNTHESLASLLEWILLSFELDYRGQSDIELYDVLVRFLWEQRRSHRRTLLIIDEAQNLGLSVLEELRMLSNINEEKGLLFQVALVGQPELLDKLNQPDMRQLAQRVSANFRLTPLSFPETYGYIRHRLRVAGGDPEIFDKAACAAIYLFSAGLPRPTNVICDAALVFAYGEDKHVVDVETVLDVVESRKRSGLAGLPSVESLDWNVLEQKIQELMESQPLPDDPREIRLLEQPELEDEELDLEEAAAFEPTPPAIAARPPQVQAISLQAPHVAPVFETPEDAAYEDEEPGAEEEESASESSTRWRVLEVAALIIIVLSVGMVLVSYFDQDSDNGRLEAGVEEPDTSAAAPLAEDNPSASQGASEASPAAVPDSQSGISAVQVGEASSTTGQQGLAGSSEGASSSQSAMSQARNQDSVQAVLNGGAGKGTLEAALGALFNEWGYDYPRIPGSTPCTKAFARALVCSEGVGDWDSLRDLNRPAMITLRSSDGRTSHVVVSKLVGEEVIVDLGDRAVKSSLDELTPLWTGDYLVLERVKKPRHQYLKEGMENEDVAWIRFSLSQIYQKDLGRSAKFDAELTALVKKFQREQGLRVDGIVGIKTFKRMVNILDQRMSPNLQQAGSYGAG